MGKDDELPLYSGLLLPTSDIRVMLKTNGDSTRIVSYGKLLALDGSCLQNCPNRPHSPSERRRCVSTPKKMARLDHFNGEAASQDRGIVTISVPAIQWLEASASDSTQHELPINANLTNPAAIFEPGVGSDGHSGDEHEAARITKTVEASEEASQFPRTDNSMDAIAMDALDCSNGDKTCRLKIGTSKVHPTAMDDAVGDSTTCQFSCRLPFNGHREDLDHYEHCPLVLFGFVLRKDNSDWLSGIPSNPGIMKAVDAIFGPCKQVLLKGTCGEEQCTSNHVIDLDVIPKQHFVKIFNIVNKWFLSNAVHPDLRAMLTMLAKVEDYSDDTFKMVISYAHLISRLSMEKHKEALTMKLIEIMVNVMGLKPWEAVRSLLVSIVTPETEPSEILNLLGIFAVTTFPVLTNHLYESISCLWHINRSFAFPQSVLFTLLDECLIQMPWDMKLTKDRMLMDLVKLPRSVLLKMFPSIEKFLGRYYPSNSSVVHAFRTSVLYGVDVMRNAGTGHYETSRVKGTGPVNPHWDSWDIHEARINAFDLVVKNGPQMKKKSPEPLRESINEKLEDDSNDDFKVVSSKNIFCYDRGPASSGFTVEMNDLDGLVEALNRSQFSQVALIMQTCSVKPHLFRESLQVLQEELKRHTKAHMAVTVHDILVHMRGSGSMKVVKSCFVQMVNAFVVECYKEEDYRSASKFTLAMKLAGVNNFDHLPEGYNLQTFAIICSDIHYQCHRYKAAIEALTYKNCLHYVHDGLRCFGRFIPEYMDQAEMLILSMLKTFLKEGLSKFALQVFRLVLSIQKSLYFPIKIDRYYEAVLFWSFVTDLNKNICSPGDGANLYVEVDRICSGSYISFSSITYRSLLVELHRANSPEYIIRRVLWICITKGTYPNFTEEPVSPLVMYSHLAKEEISIYLHYFFCYFANLSSSTFQGLTDSPLVLVLSEVPPPTTRVFPVPNDIMKTPSNIPQAMERLTSVLNAFCNGLNQTFNAELWPDRVIIPVQGVEQILAVFKEKNYHEKNKK